MIQTSCARMLMRGKVVTHVETCVLLVRELNKDDKMISIKVKMEGIPLDKLRKV